MGSHFVFVDLPKDGRSVVDRLGLPAEQASRQARDLACEGELRSRADAYRQSGIIRRRKPTRSGAEISRDESISHFRGPRPHALKAKVTHWRLLSSQSCATQPHSRTDNAHQASLVPRLDDEMTFQRMRAPRRRSARIFRRLALVMMVCCLAPARSCSSLASAAPASRRNFRRPLLPLKAIVA